MSGVDQRKMIMSGTEMVPMCGERRAKLRPERGIREDHHHLIALPRVVGKKIAIWSHLLGVANEMGVAMLTMVQHTGETQPHRVGHLLRHGTTIWDLVVLWVNLQVDLWAVPDMTTVAPGTSNSINPPREDGEIPMVHPERWTNGEITNRSVI